MIGEEIDAVLGPLPAGSEVLYMWESLHDGTLTRVAEGPDAMTLSFQVLHLNRFRVWPTDSEILFEMSGNPQAQAADWEPIGTEPGQGSYRLVAWSLPWEDELEVLEPNLAMASDRVVVRLGGFIGGGAPFSVVEISASRLRISSVDGELSPGDLNRIGEDYWSAFSSRQSQTGKPPSIE